MFSRKRKGSSEAAAEAGASSSSVTLGASSECRSDLTSTTAAPSVVGDTDFRPIDWKRLLFRPKYLVMWITFLAVGVATVVITVKHDEVVKYLRPFSEDVRRLPAGWLIPIAILVAISFPPLFGHEIVALLCGVVYGLWIGFAIVAAGTFIGEIATWFVFKRLLRKKALKLERTSLPYGCLGRMARQGGFWMVLAVRFSVIPGHMSTAVFSTCDVKFWYFVVASFLTLPKQIILVYLGVLLVQSEEERRGSVDETRIKDAVFGVTTALTVLVGVWIYFRLRVIRRALLEEQAARKEQLELDAIKASEEAFAPLDLGPMVLSPPATLRRMDGSAI